MIDFKAIAGFWSFGSYFKMGLIIPETEFNKSYEAKDNSGHGYTAAAYAIHTVTRQIIDDPIIQDYLLCTEKATKKESPKETALDILKKRYVSGEITKDQFEQMTKDIQ